MARKRPNVCDQINQSRSKPVRDILRWKDYGESESQNQIDNNVMFSLWGGTRPLQLPHDHHLLPPHHRHAPPLADVHREGDPGARLSVPVMLSVATQYNIIVATLCNAKWAVTSDQVSHTNEDLIDWLMTQIWERYFSPDIFSKQKQYKWTFAIWE